MGLSKKEIDQKSIKSTSKYDSKRIWKKWYVINRD
jgi:hypothetical protein